MAEETEPKRAEPPKQAEVSVPPGASAGFVGWLKTWPGIVSTLLGIIVAAGAAWKVLFPIFSDARIEVELTVCRPNNIVVEATNNGGRAARVGPPRFTITTLQREAELRLDQSLTNDPEGDGRFTVAAKEATGPGSETLVYQNELNFFSRREAEGNCRIEVTLPVDENAPATDECRCDYPA